MKQTLWGRLINFGTVEVGTAATEDVEVVIKDVVNPRALKEFINTERDDRQRSARTAVAAAAVVHSGKNPAPQTQHSGSSASSTGS